MATEFVRVCKVTDIPEGERRWFEFEEETIVVFNVGGRFYAIADVCTHDGGPLGEGRLEDHTIACPRHGAKFDIRTGAALTMPATEPTAAHEVKVENGELWVRLSDTGN